MDLGVKCEDDQRGEAEMQVLFCSVFPVLFSIHPWNSWHLYPDRSVPASPLGLLPHELEFCVNSALNPNFMPQLMSMRTVCLPYFSGKSEVRGNTNEIKQNSDLWLATMRSLFPGDWLQELTLGSKFLTQHCTSQILVFKIRVTLANNNCEVKRFAGTLLVTHFHLRISHWDAENSLKVKHWLTVTIRDGWRCPGKKNKLNQKSHWEAKRGAKVIRESNEQWDLLGLAPQGVARGICWWLVTGLSTAGLPGSLCGTASRCGMTPEPLC